MICLRWPKCLNAVVLVDVDLPYCTSKVEHIVAFTAIFSNIWGGAENARPENDGQRKLWVGKMQDWKMTDKNYGVWKMQEYKSS